MLRRIKLTAIAHDAGGANQLFSHLAQKPYVQIVATGPAAEIASQFGLTYKSKIEDLSFPLTEGEIWISSNTFKNQISDKVLQEVRDKGMSVKIVGFLDNWNDYSTRWNYKPDVIVTTDWYAYINAVKIFGFLKTRKYRNHYIKNIKKQFKKKKHETNISKNNIGIILQQQMRSSLSNHKEICYCLFLNQIASKIDHKLIFKNHPATKFHKCEIDTLNSLIHIGRVGLESDIVEFAHKNNEFHGYNSYLMYVLLKLGKEVYTLKKSKERYLSPTFNESNILTLKF